MDKKQRTIEWIIVTNVLLIFIGMGVLTGLWLSDCLRKLVSIWLLRDEVGCFFYPILVLGIISIFVSDWILKKLKFPFH